MAFDRKQDLQLGEGLMLYVTGDSGLLPITYATSYLTVNGRRLTLAQDERGMARLLNRAAQLADNQCSLVSKTEGHMSTTPYST